MKLNRRNFIKFSGVTAAGIAVSGLGFDLKPIKSHAQMLKTQYAKETTTICCYCAVGCGAIVHTSQRGDGRVINIEGDPDHVINQGALCPKGASLKQLTENENRLTEPMYRAPYSDKWETVSWDWAMTQIAKRSRKPGTGDSPRRMPRVRWSTGSPISPLWALPPWITRSAGSTRLSCGL